MATSPTKHASCLHGPYDGLALHSTGWLHGEPLELHFGANSVAAYRYDAGRNRFVFVRAYCADQPGDVALRFCEGK